MVYQRAACGRGLCLFIFFVLLIFAMGFALLGVSHRSGLQIVMGSALRRDYSNSLPAPPAQGRRM